MLTYNNYDEIKNNLHIFIADSNVAKDDRLQLFVHKTFLNYVTYYGVWFDNDDEIGIIYITPYLLKNFDISLDQLHEDALKCTFDQGMKLIKVIDLISEDGSVNSKNAPNLLDTKLKPEDLLFQTFMVSNKRNTYGAGLIVIEEVRKMIGDSLGVDYIAVPSSKHEIIILPDIGMWDANDVEDLTNITVEMNKELPGMEEKDIMGDTLIWCSKDGKVVETLFEHFNR